MSDYTSFENFLSRALGEGEGPNVRLVEAYDYTRPDAVETLVWHMFESFSTPQIYHLLSLLAEQDGITAENISEAWRTFNALRRSQLDTNELR